MPIHVLQLCPFTEFMENALAARFTVHRWFEIADRAGWLRDHAAAIRAVVTSGTLGMTGETMALLPALEIVAISGVGYDAVDLATARSRGVRVTNTPDVLTDDVADLTVGLIVALLRRLPPADRFAREGRWANGAFPLARKVSGRRFGIFGYGRIGAAIHERLRPMGPVSYCATADKANGLPFHRSAAELAAQCDVLILASSASADTIGVIDARVLAALGPTGWLVNVARGSLIDQHALIAALDSGGIAGAALDVFADEPAIPPALAALENVVLAPHIGSATHETRDAMAQLVVANLDAHFAGQALPTPVP